MPGDRELRLLLEQLDPAPAGTKGAPPAWCSCHQPGWDGPDRRLQAPPVKGTNAAKQLLIGIAWQAPAIDQQP
jgi:hypothetical protein